jgi:hypothetical protein
VSPRLLARLISETWRWQQFGGWITDDHNAFTL